MPNDANSQPSGAGGKLHIGVALLYGIYFALLMAVIPLGREGILDAEWAKVISENGDLLFIAIAVACAAAAIPAKIPFSPTGDFPSNLLDMLGRMSAFVGVFYFSADQESPINWLMMSMTVPIVIMYFIALLNWDVSADILLVKIYKWVVVAVVIILGILVASLVVATGVSALLIAHAEIGIMAISLTFVLLIAALLMALRKIL